jgi:hypothetical protein
MPKRKSVVVDIPVDKRPRTIERELLVADDESDEEGQQEIPVSAPRVHVDDAKFGEGLPKWHDNRIFAPFAPYSRKQKKVNKYHITKRAAGTNKPGTRLHVPPFHPSWPHKVFPAKATLKTFLKALATSQLALDILRYEVNWEYKVLTTPKHQTFNFNRANMQWQGWSGMLQLETSFQTVMKGCTGFPQCLHHLINHTFDEKGAFGKVPTEHMMDVILTDYLQPIQTIWEYMWRDVGIVNTSAVTDFIHKKVHAAIATSPTFKRTFKAEAALRRIEMVKKSTLVVPKLVEEQAAKQAQGRVRKSLRRPQEIHEVDILNGVRKLTHVIWEGGDTTTEPQPLDDGTSFSDRAKAICCLAELMCGSRQFGVMMVNWFDAVNTHTADTWRAEQEDDAGGVDEHGRYGSLKAISSLFGRTQKCIVVSRLTKEQTAQAQVAKANSSLLPGEKKMTLEEVVERKIVKPLNWMFVDQAFLNLGKKVVASLVEKDGTDIFLQMMKVLRLYIKGKLTEKKIKVVEHGGMWGLHDDLVRQTPKKVRDLVQGYITQINRYARRIFKISIFGEEDKSIFLPNQGTHLFRKIYMNWAFNHFSADRMKETGFASAVLGHRGFSVSLNYTSLLITPSLAPKMTDMGFLKMQFANLRGRLEALEGRAFDDNVDFDDLDPSNVTLEDRDGESVRIKKLKISRKTAWEDRLDLYIAKLNEMVDMYIDPTVTKQSAVGITTDAEKRKLLVADSRYTAAMARL